MYGFIIAGILTAMAALDLWGDEAPPDLGVALLKMAGIAAAVGMAGLCISAYILWRQGELAVDDQRFLRKARFLGAITKESP